MHPHPSQHDPHGQRNPYGPSYAPGGPSVDPRAQLASGVDQFMTRVNVWMAAGVGVTGLVAFLVSTSVALMELILFTPLFWVAMFAPLVFVFVLAGRVHKMSPSAAIAFLWASLGSIAIVFAITTIMYGSLALWGYATKRDLSAWGKFLFMGLIGLIASALFFMFVPGAMGSTAYLIYNVIGVLIFSGLTAYDTQKIKQVYLVSGGAGNLAITGALTLYLDFINLFLFLLRLFNSRD
jgi:uncharacterized protein